MLDPLLGFLSHSPLVNLPSLSREGRGGESKKKNRNTRASQYYKKSKDDLKHLYTNGYRLNVSFVITPREFRNQSRHEHKGSQWKGYRTLKAITTEARINLKYGLLNEQYKLIKILTYDVFIYSPTYELLASNN